jgi:hypothetical protein
MEFYSGAKMVNKKDLKTKYLRSKNREFTVSANNVRHPVSKNFTALQYTSLHCRHFTFSHLNSTHLHPVPSDLA